MKSMKQRIALLHEEVVRVQAINFFREQDKKEVKEY